MVPDLEAVVVDRVLADEVHRADDEIPVAPLQQRRHPVLAAADPVRLDAELQVGLLADEAGVVVDVVDRALAPQRVAPDSSACAKRYMCSAQPSSAMPRSCATVAVALGVRGGEVPPASLPGSSGRRCRW